MSSALRPVEEVAKRLDLSSSDLILYGDEMAKIRPCVRQRSRSSDRKGPARLVLVSAIKPTPAGEGKTTTSIGLAQGSPGSENPSAWHSVNPRWGHASE